MIKINTQLAAIICSTFFLLQHCTYNEVDPQPTFDCSIDPLELTEASITDAGCNVNDGRVELVVVNGTSPFTFTLGSLSQDNGIYENLAAGNYTAEVVDSNGCSASIQVTVGSVEGVVINSVEIQPAGCETSQGQISVNADEGTQPYTYSLDGSPFQSANVFTSLSVGTKNLLVRDANGCEFEQSVQIQSGVSFSNTINPIIQNNCAISGCHNGSQFPDLRNFDAIQASANRIKVRTGNRSMPQNGSLTQAQIDNIACWVDDGAPNN